MAKSVLARLFACASPSDITGESCKREYSTSPQHSFSCSLMEENVSFAESIIAKWDSDSSNDMKLTSLFDADHGEATCFLRALTDLRRALLFFSSSDCPESFSIRKQCLIRAQNLMHTAMGRLEKEFHHILSTNCQHINSVSRFSSSFFDEEEIQLSTSSAIADLRSIAESMMANGYGMECVRIYKLLRKSILKKALFLLGFELHIPYSNFHKIDWSFLVTRIESWLAAARISFPSHFPAERLLCNHVFDASDSDDIDLTESCFADVTGAAALQFLSFPQMIAKTKPSPEKLFNILELYQTLYDLYPNIESTFSYESTTAVKEKAIEALQSLAEAARDSLAEFELAVQKESSKIPVPGGGVHPLIRNSMSYLVSLAHHLPALINVYAGIPFRPPERLPDMSAPCPSTIVPASVSERIAWLLLIILCKLDHKAEFYKEVSHSYLFLANNVQYVVNEVNGSGLRVVLGARWVDRHEKTARQYMERYLRFGSGKAVEFEEAAAGQEETIVQDETMIEEVKAEVEGIILPLYEEQILGTEY